MMKPTDDTRKVLKTLREKLNNLYYDQVQLACRLNYYFLDPWPSNLNIFEGAMRALPHVNRLSYELLLLGKTLSIKDVEGIFTTDEIQDLVRIGLLKRDGELVNMGDLSILSFLGRYFIVSNASKPFTYEQRNHIVYMGMDSYLLTNNLSVPKGGLVLDLGTGSGIQAVLASDRAEKAIGVEIDDEVANMAACNVALNNVEDKVEIRVGDLYEPVSGEQFDIICSNPPFKPVPQDVGYFLMGNGGPDGLRVINGILNGLEDHLAMSGKCFITCDLIGDEKGPLLETKLRKLSEENNWSTTLLLPHRDPIYHLAVHMANLARIWGIDINDVSKDELLLRWNKMFKELGVNKNYSPVICIISKVNNFKFHRIDLYKYFPELPEIKFSEPFNLDRIRNLFGKKSNR